MILNYGEFAKNFLLVLQTQLPQLKVKTKVFGGVWL